MFWFFSIWNFVLKYVDMITSRLKTKFILEPVWCLFSRIKIDKYRNPPPPPSSSTKTKQNKEPNLSNKVVVDLNI